MAGDSSDDAPSPPTLQQLRHAIPKHCFDCSATTSTYYILRDIALAGVLAASALLIPLVTSFPFQCLLWATYGFTQGLIFTGIWIIAHECGHRTLFTRDVVNNTFGFALHSFLLVPYFSWKYSHSKHHRYANHMDKDTAFVPRRKDSRLLAAQLQKLLHYSEDTPLHNLIFLLGHQLVGWPLYLLFGITAGKDHQTISTRFNSHFNPKAAIFEKWQERKVLLSDVGIAVTVLCLVKVGQTIGWGRLFLLYGMPYLWVNHWIVAITFLHHSHPSAKHYETDAWTFQDGAMSTVDREFGFVGRHLFHGIIEYHVIHHLFPRIAFYHAEEATAAIVPMLGKSYLRDDTPFWRSLWSNFRRLQYVEPMKGDAGVLVWHTA